MSAESNDLDGQSNPTTLQTARVRLQELDTHLPYQHGYLDLHTK